MSQCPLAMLVSRVRRRERRLLSRVRSMLVPRAFAGYPLFEGFTALDD